MNRLSFTFLCLSFCFAVSLSAQFSLGVKTGYTQAWPDYGDIELPEDANTSVDGYHVAITAYQSLGKFLSVGIEPGFTKKGMACVPGWQPIFEGDSRLILDYVEAPVFINGNFGVGIPNLSMNVGLGYGLSMMTQAVEEIFTLPEDAIVERRELSIGGDFDRVNQFDHGVYGKLGFAYDLKIGQLVLESSYYRGMTDVARFSFSKSRNLNLSAGFRFAF